MKKPAAAKAKAKGTMKRPAAASSSPPAKKPKASPIKKAAKAKDEPTTLSGSVEALKNGCPGTGRRQPALG